MQRAISSHRDIGAQRQQTFDVRDYGARGDGTTDDTAAIQSAITTAGNGGITFFPPGYTFKVRRLSLPTGARLVGYGATLTRSTTLGGGLVDAMIENASLGATDIEVSGLTLRTSVAKCIMTFGEVTGLAIRDVNMTRTAGTAYGIWLQNCVDVAITGGRIDQGPDKTMDGFHADGAANVTITGVNIKSGDDCISFTSGATVASITTENVTVSNCALESRSARLFVAHVLSGGTHPIRRIVVSNVSGKTSTGGGAEDVAAGIAIKDDTSGLLVQDVALTNVIVDGSACPADNNSHGIDATYVDGLKLTNVTVLSPGGGGFNFLHCQNVAAVQSESRGSRNGQAWQVYGSPKTRLISCRSVDHASGTHHFTIGSGADASDDCVVVGCETTGGTVGGNGIYLRNTARSYVAGNILASAGLGIIEASPSDSNIIVGNNLNAITSSKLTIVGTSTWDDRNRGVNVTGVSADVGNAAKTLTVRTSNPVQRWATALTADRAVTLSTSGAFNGAQFRIIRTATATGAFNLTIGTGPLKALTAGQWADVTYDGSAWLLTAAGSL